MTDRLPRRNEGSRLTDRSLRRGYPAMGEERRDLTTYRGKRRPKKGSGWGGVGGGGGGGGGWVGLATRVFKGPNRSVGEKMRLQKRGRKEKWNETPEMVDCSDVAVRWLRPSKKDVLSPPLILPKGKKTTHLPEAKRI